MDNQDPELGALRSRVAQYDELWAQALPRLQAFDQLQSAAAERGASIQNLINVCDIRSSQPESSAGSVETPPNGRSVTEYQMNQLLAERDAMRKDLDALVIERQSAVAELTAILNDLDTIRRDVRQLMNERARLAREVNALRNQRGHFGPVATERDVEPTRPLRVPTPNRAPSPSPSLDVNLAPTTLLPASGFVLDTTDEEEAAFEAFFGAVDDRSAKERAWMLTE